MDNIREKLVEILVEPCCGLYPASELADYLIEQGVTVQEWIPVTERLPEKNTANIVVDQYGIVFQCLYAYDGWDLWEGNEVVITHWMPLPQPPKGE